MINECVYAKIDDQSSVDVNYIFKYDVTYLECDHFISDIQILHYNRIIWLHILVLKILCIGGYIDVNF